VATQEGNEMFEALAIVLLGIVGIVFVKRRNSRKKLA
jgi:LPXTG-motif cell wall-anchored protein